MDKRLRLLKNFILISIPLFMIILLAFFTPMYYMTEEYVLWRQEKDYVNQNVMSYVNYTKPDTIPLPKAGSPVETLIIGDSRAKSSIIPKQLKPDGDIYNIGIGGATSIEMYYAAGNYIKSYGAPKEALIIFAPYHLCDIDNWDQTLFNNYLTVGEISQVYKEAYRYKDEEILRKGYLTEELSFRLRLPTKYIAQMYDARLTGFFSRNKERYGSVSDELGYCEFGKDPGNDGVNYEVHHEYFDSSPLVLHYYDKLLKLLTENGVKVKILQAPINEASSKAIHTAFVNGYEEFLSEIKEKYKDIYIMKELPVYENGYFGDNNHLNRSGAEKYTDWLKNMLY